MEFARPLDCDVLQPSFFDLLSLQNFNQLLPALFEPFTRQNQRNKLIFAVGRAVVDLVMMAGFGGTATEVIYGLERVCKRPGSKWIIYLVTILESHLHHVPLPSTFKRLLQFLDLGIKLSYITNDSKSFSLLHALTGIIYKHSSTDVYERRDPMGRIIKSLLVVGQLVVFLIQSGVLDRNKKQSIISSSSSPPPQPSPLSLSPPPHPDGYPLPKRSGICPCCLEKFLEPVAVVSSGYVYCRRCLGRRVECPVTKIPINRIISLYT